MFGEHIRIEHWTNAVEQGRYTASSRLGSEGSPYVGLPYCWTDQFGAPKRTVGLVTGADRIAILHMDDTSLVALYGQGDSIRGAICVNSPRALIGCRQMITQDLPWARAMAGSRA